MNMSIAEERERERQDSSHGFNGADRVKSGPWVGNHNLGANGGWATIRRTGGKG